jgi:hypothetical protein
MTELLSYAAAENDRCTRPSGLLGSSGATETMSHDYVEIRGMAGGLAALR